VTLPCWTAGWLPATRHAPGRSGPLAAWPASGVAQPALVLSTLQVRVNEGEPVSELIVIGYDSQATATEAYNKVMSLSKDFVVTLSGLAIVTVDAEGKSHVETPQKIVGVSAASGALWGMLIGLLFFVPGVGLLLGGAMGALFGKLGKSGINDQFRSQVQDMLTPGSAAVVVMASKITEDKFADAMGPFGGKLLKTSLSEEDEKELASELAEGNN
jgi:uncharacterized membrane protein